MALKLSRKAKSGAIDIVEASQFEVCFKKDHSTGYSEAVVSFCCCC
jgi:hypothetical protein